MPPANEEPVVIQSMETTELHRAVHGRLPLKLLVREFNLLAYTLAGESGRWIVTGTDMGKYTTDLVDPEPALGFDVTVGSYLPAVVWSRSPIQIGIQRRETRHQNRQLRHDLFCDADLQ